MSSAIYATPSTTRKSTESAQSTPATVPAELESNAVPEIHNVNPSSSSVEEESNNVSLLAEKLSTNTLPENEAHALNEETQNAVNLEPAESVSEHSTITDPVSTVKVDSLVTSQQYSTESQPESSTAAGSSIISSEAPKPFLPVSIPTEGGVVHTENNVEAIVTTEPTQPIPVVHPSSEIPLVVLPEVATVVPQIQAKEPSQVPITSESFAPVTVAEETTPSSLLIPPHPFHENISEVVPAEPSAEIILPANVVLDEEQNNIVGVDLKKPEVIVSDRPPIINEQTNPELVDSTSSEKLTSQNTLNMETTTAALIEELEPIISDGGIPDSIPIVVDEQPPIVSDLVNTEPETSTPPVLEPFPIQSISESPTQDKVTSDVLPETTLNPSPQIQPVMIPISGENDLGENSLKNSESQQVPDSGLLVSSEPAQVQPTEVLPEEVKDPDLGSFPTESITIIPTVSGSSSMHLMSTVIPPDTTLDGSTTPAPFEILPSASEIVSPASIVAISGEIMPEETPLKLEDEAVTGSSVESSTLNSVENSDLPPDGTNPEHDPVLFTKNSTQPADAVISASSVTSDKDGIIPAGENFHGEGTSTRETPLAGSQIPIEETTTESAANFVNYQSTSSISSTPATTEVEESPTSASVSVGVSLEVETNEFVPKPSQEMEPPVHEFVETPVREDTTNGVPEMVPLLPPKEDIKPAEAMSQVKPSTADEQEELVLNIPEIHDAPPSSHANSQERLPAIVVNLDTGLTERPEIIENGIVPNVKESAVAGESMESSHVEIQTTTPQIVSDEVTAEEQPPHSPSGKAKVPLASDPVDQDKPEEEVLNILVDETVQGIKEELPESDNSREVTQLPEIVTTTSASHSQAVTAATQESVAADLNHEEIPVFDENVNELQNPQEEGTTHHPVIDEAPSAILSDEAHKPIETKSQISPEGIRNVTEIMEVDPIPNDHEYHPRSTTAKPSLEAQAPNAPDTESPDSETLEEESSKDFLPSNQTPEVEVVVETTVSPPEEKFRLDLSIFSHDVVETNPGTEVPLVDVTAPTEGEVVFETINPDSHLPESAKIPGKVPPINIATNAPVHGDAKSEQEEEDRVDADIPTSLPLLQRHHILEHTEDGGEIDTTVSPLQLEINTTTLESEIKENQPKFLIPVELVKKVYPISDDIEAGNSRSDLRSDADNEVSSADSTWYWRTFDRVRSLFPTTPAKSSRKPRSLPSSAHPDHAHPERVYWGLPRLIFW